MRGIRQASSSLRAAWVALLLGLVAAGCATTNPGANPERDPWEGLNRKTFAFNEGLDRYFLQPIATGWDFVVPGVAQTGIDNVFDNLGTPISFGNNVLQAKPVHAFEDFARFLLNSSLGLAGLFDMASAIGIPVHNEDFGQTLGVWGMPPGPYLVLPLLGPSSPRDTAGLVVDAASYPWSWFVPIYVTTPARALAIVNLRAIYLEEIAANRESAFDYYVFSREAWIDHRAKRVADQSSADKSQDDLYYFEDESE